MSTSIDEQGEQKQFFGHYFVQENDQCFQRLLNKYKAYEHPSYAHKKNIQEVNYVKKYRQVCGIMPFSSPTLGEKVEITTMENLIKQIYQDYLHFLSIGGWRVVANKSLSSRMQQYLLLKLARAFPAHKATFHSLDRFVLAFFFTLNYLKTCNYEIKIFSDLLEKQCLERFFLFLLLFHCSRRVSKDLVVSSERVGQLVRVLKGESGEGQSWEEEEGDVKLVLMYAQLIEYMDRNNAVLHEIMIFNLLRAAGMTLQGSVEPQGPLNWKEFFQHYFSELLTHQKDSFQANLIRRAIELNLTMSNQIFGSSLAASYATYSQSELNDSRQQKYLQESFGVLVTSLDRLIKSSDGAQTRQRRLFESGRLLYESGMDTSKSIVGYLMKKEDFYGVYQRYC